MLDECTKNLGPAPRAQHRTLTYVGSEHTATGTRYCWTRGEHVLVAMSHWDGVTVEFSRSDRLGFIVPTLAELEAYCEVRESEWN